MGEQPDFTKNFDRLQVDLLAGFPSMGIKASNRRGDTLLCSSDHSPRRECAERPGRMVRRRAFHPSLLCAFALAIKRPHCVICDNRGFVAKPRLTSAKTARHPQHGSTDMSVLQQPRTISLPLPAQTRWSVCYKGQPIGLISPDGDCTATLRLPTSYSVTPYHGQLEGPGWLTLKVGPDTSIALSALGLSIGTIDLDRSVQFSSRFPRWIEITRVSPVETPSPSSCSRASQSAEPPGSPRGAQSDFDHRCDPRGPWARKSDRNKCGSHSQDLRHRERARRGGCKPQPS
jgi:hypothetical protein